MDDSQFKERNQVSLLAGNPPEKLCKQAPSYAAGQESVGKAELSLVTLRVSQPPFSGGAFWGAQILHEILHHASISYPAVKSASLQVRCRPDGPQHHLGVAGQKSSSRNHPK